MAQTMAKRKGFDYTQFTYLVTDPLKIAQQAFKIKLSAQKTKSAIKAREKFEGALRRMESASDYAPLFLKLWGTLFDRYATSVGPREAVGFLLNKSLNRIPDPANPALENLIYRKLTEQLRKAKGEDVILFRLQSYGEAAQRLSGAKRNNRKLSDRALKTWHDRAIKFPDPRAALKSMPGISDFESVAQWTASTIIMRNVARLARYAEHPPQDENAKEFIANNISSAVRRLQKFTKDDSRPKWSMDAAEIMNGWKINCEVLYPKDKKTCAKYVLETVNSLMSENRDLLIARSLYDHFFKMVDDIGLKNPLDAMEILTATDLSNFSEKDGREILTRFLDLDAQIPSGVHTLDRQEIYRKALDGFSCGPYLGKNADNPDFVDYVTHRRNEIFEKLDPRWIKDSDRARAIRKKMEWLEQKPAGNKDDIIVTARDWVQALATCKNRSHEFRQGLESDSLSIRRAARRIIHPQGPSALRKEIGAMTMTHGKMAAIGARNSR